MRRDKTSLLLMEQLVTLMVFALAAAICLRAFVTADSRSRTMENREKAAVLCQNAAETLRGSGGDLAAALRQVTGQQPGAPDAQGMDPFVDYREDWTVIDHWDARGGSGDTVYRLVAEPVDSGVNGLGKASVSVLDAKSGDELFRLEVAWQEVTADE